MTENIFSGTYRIVHRDANDNTIAELLEKLHSEFGFTNASNSVTATFETDMQKMPKVKKHLSTILREDDKLVIQVKADTDVAVDVDDDDQKIMVPVTFRNTRTGTVYEKTLAYGDFTAKVAADTTLKSGIWYDYLTYTIPAQSQLKIGHSIQDVRVDSALYLAWDADINT